MTTHRQQSPRDSLDTRKRYRYARFFQMPFALGLLALTAGLLLAAGSLGTANAQTPADEETLDEETLAGLIDLLAPPPETSEGEEPNLDGQDISVGASISDGADVETPDVTTAPESSSTEPESSTAETESSSAETEPAPETEEAVTETVEELQGGGEATEETTAEVAPAAPVSAPVVSQPSQAAPTTSSSTSGNTAASGTTVTPPTAGDGGLVTSESSANWLPTATLILVLILSLSTVSLSLVRIRRR